MSRTLHFGRDVLNAPDVDLEDLLNALAPTEVNQLLEEMQADPDDKHLPPSVRTAYKCNKDPTGPLNRDSLIEHINEESKNAPDREEAVPYEPGKKRGKVFVPKYNEEELAQMKRKEELEEATKLDDDEEEALSQATTEDLMTLAEILGSNPQAFIMEAYADPLKYYPPDPPNTTDPKETAEKITSNDKETKDVNLNNIKGISEELMCEIFDGLRNNENLVRLSAANCDVNDFCAATLALALEQNNTLKSLNLESNHIAPESLATLFEALAKHPNGVVEVRVANQAQKFLGHKVENRIADAISKNNTLLKVGLSFEFPEVMDKVQAHLIKNIDRLRKERVRKEGIAQAQDWTPARLLDMEHQGEEGEHEDEHEDGNDDEKESKEHEKEPTAEKKVQEAEQNDETASEE